MRISDWSSDVCSSDLALAQALPLHPMSQALLPDAVQRRLACLLLILLPVSTIGEAKAVALQQLTFLMIADWLVAVHIGTNSWSERTSPAGLSDIGRRSCSE